MDSFLCGAPDDVVVRSGMKPWFGSSSTQATGDFLISLFRRVKRLEEVRRLFGVYKVVYQRCFAVFYARMIELLDFLPLEAFLNGYCGEMAVEFIGLSFCMYFSGVSLFEAGFLELGVSTNRLEPYNITIAELCFSLR